MVTRLDNVASTPAVAPHQGLPQGLSFLNHLPREDPRVFWAVWEHYRGDLLAPCCLRWMDGNREEAEDALSSASLRAWRYWPTYAHNILNIRAWLLRLLYNHCMNIRRAAKRQQQIIQAEESLPERGSRQFLQESLEAVILQQEMYTHLHQAIATLPRRLQEPLWLHVQKGLSPRDIAQQLQLTPENVRKRLQQARLLLRKQL